MTRSRESDAPPIVGAKGRSKIWSTVIMLGSTAVMLALVFPPFYCFFLAPVALVPLSICVLRRPLTWGYLLAYYLAGVGFFLPNLFWLAPVTVGGWIALSLFVAVYVAVYAAGMRRLVVDLRLPATVAVPVVWTAVEYIRGTFILGGFPWFMLGNCLTPVPALIQAADLVGVWGLTFLLAMMNGLVVDVLRLPLYQKVAASGKKGAKEGMRFSRAIKRLVAVVMVLTVGWISYGVLRMQETATKAGPRVTVLQENIPQSLKRSDADETLMRYMRLSEGAVAAEPKPDLVVWPETMVTATINKDWLTAAPDKFEGAEGLGQALAAVESRKQGQMAEAGKMADANLRSKVIQDAQRAAWYQRCADVYEALNQEVEKYDVPLLVGYTAVTREGMENRTLLLAPGTPEAVRSGEYAKRHLVPFGEYIPFKGVPVVGRLMLVFSPVDFDYSNTPGDAWTRFKLTVSSRSVDAAGTQISTSTRFYEFGTPICFEDTMPEPAREMARARENGRKADFLVNVSNDGWFHWVELDQHLQACQMRAVENRVAIARSVNTGDSGFIDSCGRIVKLVTEGAGNSAGAVGTASWVVQVDGRETFFSRIGDLFPIICGMAGTLLVGWTFVRPRRGRTGASTAAGSA